MEVALSEFPKQKIPFIKKGIFRVLKEKYLVSFALIFL